MFVNWLDILKNLHHQHKRLTIKEIKKKLENILTKSYVLKYIKFEQKKSGLILKMGLSQRLKVNIGKQWM